MNPVLLASLCGLLLTVGVIGLILGVDETAPGSWKRGFRIIIAQLFFAVAIYLVLVKGQL